MRLVIICPLTSDIEAQLYSDIAIGISDGVAPLVGTCDSLEHDVLFADTDAALVALPERPDSGQQHQSRTAGGKSQRCWTQSHRTVFLMLGLRHELFAYNIGVNVLSLP